MEWCYPDENLEGTPKKRMFFSLCVGAVGCALSLQFPATALAKEKETVIFSFDHKDGASPGAGLIDVKGTLYGTTDWGPNCSLRSNVGCGVVFSVKPISPNSRAEKTLYSFCSQQNCTDGQYPLGSLIDVNGMLYGTTQYGGTVNCVDEGYLGCGTIFSIDPTGGAETVVHSFGKGTDGTIPVAGLIDVNGTLYGTTSGGGANCQNSGGCGTVFALDPETGSETVLYSFCAQQNCSDGSQPFAGLTDVKGTLYGTTLMGGANYTDCNGYGCGTAFALDLKTGAETVLYSFCAKQNCSDGSLPSAGLIDVNGRLYGTTGEGGSSVNRYCSGGCGTVFSLDAATGDESVLYAFCSQPVHHQCRDGDFPNAGLTDMNGTLYGATPLGGVYTNDLPGSGVVFALDPKTGAERLVYAFSNPLKDGANSWGGLIVAGRTLYGTTACGGAHGGVWCEGTVFALRP